MFRYLLVALLIACVPLPASAQRATQEQLSSRISTPMFVRKATAGNLFEIQSSRLALTRSRDNRVRSFARHLIEDHRMAGRQLRASLRRAGLRRPPERMDARHLNLLAQMRDTRRREFDNAFVEAQIEAHRNAISLFRGYARTGQNPQLRQFAHSALPVLEGHLNTALRLAPRVAVR